MKIKLLDKKMDKLTEHMGDIKTALAVISERLEPTATDASLATMKEALEPRITAIETEQKHTATKADLAKVKLSGAQSVFLGVLAVIAIWAGLSRLNNTVKTTITEAFTPLASEVKDLKNNVEGINERLSVIEARMDERQKNRP